MTDHEPEAPTPLAATSRPPSPSPAALAARPRRATKPVLVAGLDPATIEAASAFGLVEDGRVFVIDGDSRHDVGPAAGDIPLVPFIRTYVDRANALERFRARLEGGDANLKEIDSSLAAAQAMANAPDGVGDLAAFRILLTAVAAEAKTVRDSMAAERDAARSAAVAEREALVAKAEAIVGKAVGSIHWKNDTIEMRGLLDEWKAAQQEGTRIGKEAEKALWTRFAHARSTFEKNRKHHFLELDKANSDVAGRKEALATRAETIATSTKWDETATEFRTLMAEWKTIGRGRRTVDDAVWARFQTAQDAFFEARRAILEVEHGAESANLQAKLALVAEAEKLLPVKDLKAAKAALRGIQDRFEAIGRVPKADIATLTKRLGAVEREIRGADEAAWTKRNPEVEARVSGAAQQLLTAISDLDQKIEKAIAKGDTAVAATLKEAREARQLWLDQIQSVAK